ncbi:MAG TPA: intradiol ring-cleavage dioxygenase [Burkholderiaceae bacterium]|nr:intradiol ring-cleavage dioxygenase [Burkholderiaceae bacterium]
MRNIDENTITPAVLERIAGTEDERLKQIMTALVTHLHDFVREVKLTESEWQAGIEFLTATGLKCSATRQEFILLSDTLGVSMLTIALNHAKPAGATEATVFGPFHVEDAPRVASGTDIARDAPGLPMFVQARVRGLDGEPIADAEVDVWQADEDGLYDVQRPELGATRRARAVLRTDEQGGVAFRSVVPTAYPIPTDGPVGEMLVATGRHPWRPAHLHFRIRAEGYQTLTTHLFKDPDPYLDSDVVFGVRSSLVGDYVEHPAGLAPDGSMIGTAFYTLAPTFVLPRQR